MPSIPLPNLSPNGSSSFSPNLPPKVQITSEMMKNFKVFTCDCGGKLFHSGMIIKIISPLLSPSGKEEQFPIEVLICNSCGKVPNAINNQLQNILPEDVLAKSSNILL